MNRRHAIGLAWVLIGLALGVWAIWAAATTSYVPAELILTWLLQAAYAVLAATAGIAFARGAHYGRALLRIVSILSLVYSLAWLLLGGIQDVPHYAIPLLVIAALSVYGLVLSRPPPSAV